MGARPRRNPCVTVALLVIGAAILAIVLGLGLGLGLKHNHKSSDTAVQSTPPGNSSSSNGTLPFLQPQSQSNLVLNSSIQGQSPQTRVYNFTVDQANGAPDGVNRTMFVVNGVCCLYLLFMVISHFLIFSKRTISRSDHRNQSRRPAYRERTE